MACVTPDGKPTASGMALLRALSEGLCSPEEIAEKTNMSLFRVRSGLREMSFAGLTSPRSEGYELTEKGAKSLRDAS
jgi:predicted transcriptional regulator